MVEGAHGLSGDKDMKGLVHRTDQTGARKSLARIPKGDHE